jgi:hypothetical protein
LNRVKSVAEGKAVWAVCGPRNEYMCDRWRRFGVVFGEPPLKTAGVWKLYRVDKWPQDTVSED